MHYAFLYVHFFAVTARLWRENAYFHVSQRKYTTDDKISSLFLNLVMVLRNSTLGGSTYIWQSQWLGVYIKSRWRLKGRELTFSATFLLPSQSSDLKVRGMQLRLFLEWNLAYLRSLSSLSRGNMRESQGTKREFQKKKTRERDFRY